MFDPGSCLFCRGVAAPWFDKTSRDDGKVYRLHRCRDCGGAFVFPIPSSEDLTAFYQGEANRRERSSRALTDAEALSQALEAERRYPNSSLDAARLAGRLSALSPGRLALDVGAGHGFFTRALVENGFRVDAIELSAPSRGVFTAMNGFSPMAAFFDEAYAQTHAQTYDAVLLSQVLEHLPMDTRPIDTIAAVLKPGGVCAIAVPHFGSWLSRIQGRGDMFISPPEHINFFTTKALRAAFAAHGLTCEGVETISRYDFGRLRRRFGPLAAAPGLALGAFFKLSDSARGGMYLNAYFRKP